MSCTCQHYFSLQFQQNHRYLFQDRTRLYNSPRSITKLSHHTIWSALLEITRNLSMTLNFRKAQLHSTNEIHNRVDNLAKDAFSANPLSYTTDASSFISFLSCWNDTVIDSHWRHFIRMTSCMKGIHSWKALNRNTKYRSLNVDWSLTFRCFNDLYPKNTTSFVASNTKRSRVSFITEELPTLAKLQSIRPNIYDPNWLCFDCNMHQENFVHVWTCPS